MKMFRFKRGDFALSAALLVAAGLIALSFLGAERGSTGMILVGDEILHKIDLRSVDTPYTIDVEGSGHRLAVRIERGRMRVLSADCPDQTCVHMGWLSRAGQSAVCLPARILLRVEGGRPEVDAVLR